jgi:glycogen(starch) synthase
LHSGYTFRTAAILQEQRRLGWETLQLTTPRHGRVSQNVADAGEWHFQRTVCEPNAWSRIPGVIYGQEMAATARRIVELVNESDPDILHAHSPVLNALPALWARRKTGIPVVYEVRALWEDAAVDHGVTREGSLRYGASRALETFALRHADHVATICEGLSEEIAARGVPRDRITVVPNAVDAAQFRIDAEPDAELRSRLGLDGTTVAGVAGSF